MTVDTLDYVKKLEAAGVDRRQAEAHAQALRDTVSVQIATKADVDALRLATKQEISDLELRRIKYMVGQTVAIVGLLVAAIRFLG